MKWCSVLGQPRFSEKEGVAALLEPICNEVLDKLSGQKPDLLFLFVAAQYMDLYEEIGRAIYDRLSPGAMVGCSAGGLIAAGSELEDEGGIVIAAAILPDVQIKAFHLEDNQLPDQDDAPGKWEELIGVKQEEDPSFILLPDPFSFRAEALVQGLDYAFPKGAKIGGLASAASTPGKNALYLNDKMYRRGAVGIATVGNIILDTVVAQGCRPIGAPMRVTKCDNNILYGLDGKSALVVLRDLLEGLSETDQKLARNSLFLGLAMDEFKSDFGVGDFLIRNLIGIDPKSGALVVGEVLHNERTVQFHVRDAATSSDDLRSMLKSYKDNEATEVKKEGALLFSCLGRGSYLYGSPNHDSNGFRQYFGEIPLSGFFCNGEIGPVGGTTFIHGYTSSFGIFKEKSKASG